MAVIQTTHIGILMTRDTPLHVGILRLLMGDERGIYL